MNEELNEQEIRQLEQELRSFGDPYGSPEPDPRYFANFRARVMERIAEEPASTIGVMQRVTSFFFGSPWRFALSGGGLVAGALLYFGLQSSPDSSGVVADEIRTPERQERLTPMPENTPPAVAEQDHSNAPKPVMAQKEEPQQTRQVIPVTPQPPEQNVVETPAPVSGNIADAAAAFDKMDELTVSDDTEPVSYDRLSMEELEAVLKTLETEPLTIQ